METFRERFRDAFRERFMERFRERIFVIIISAASAIEVPALIAFIFYVLSRQLKPFAGIHDRISDILH